MKGAIFKIGTKDDKVYFEFWNNEDTVKFVDGDLQAEQAYHIGKSFMDNAIKQGYRP